jgi:hypothetical protein
MSSAKAVETWLTTAKVAASSARDGNGLGSGRVDRKPDLQKIIVGLNLTPKPAPVGAIWHSNPSGFGCLLSFCKWADPTQHITRKNHNKANIQELQS